MTETLIERLRQEKYHSDELCYEAADALTVAQARIERLEAELAAAKTAIPEGYYTLHASIRAALCRDRQTEDKP